MCSEDFPADMTVLVVDDDPAIRDSLQILLESHGLPVLTFESGSDFLANCDMDEPGCLVLDIHMPTMSGFELLRQIAAGGRDLPTIMISSHADVETRRNALKAGAFDLLEKPFDGDVLCDALSRLLGSSPKSGDSL